MLSATARLLFVLQTMNDVDADSALVLFSPPMLLIRCACLSSSPFTVHHATIVTSRSFYVDAALRASRQKGDGFVA